MICPQCKGEYRDGFTQCADCKIKLVKELPPLPQQPKPDPFKPIIIYRTSNVHEANMVKGMLEGFGISVFIYDANIARMNPFISHAVGGIRVVVDEKDSALATELLKSIGENKGGKNSPWG